VKTPHPPVKINGPARYAGLDLPHDIKGGCGLTYGVDADFFAEWLRLNRDEPYVKYGLVFAQPTGKPGEIDAQIKDHRKRMSGMEPLDPKNLPEEFKGKIEKADGVEPALEVMSGDAAAGDGSTVTHAPPVTAPEMAATSDTPAEDTPRSEPDVLAVKRSQKPASAMIAEELNKK
jgi:hypothetical protein